MSGIKLRLAVGTAIFALLSSSAFAQSVNVENGIAELTISGQTSALSNIDFDGAQAIPMPTLPSLPTVPPGALLPGGEVGSETFGEFGSANPWEKPYNTKRVATITNGVPATRKPYSAAGKLYFRDGSSSFVCSGSLVRPGVVITAAHCVSEFGQSRFYTDFVFVPGKHFGQEFYGRWTSDRVVINTSYYNGTDECEVSGVVCESDIAIIQLTPQTNFNNVVILPGDQARAGRFGISFNDNAFNRFKEAAITQLGYPVSHDRGNAMQETNSQSTQVAGFVDNNVIGSRQTGGSSGGPWLVNQGYKASLAGLPNDNINPRNLVVGVTSWGYISPTVQIQGASRLTSENTANLLNFIGCTVGSQQRHCSE